MEVYLIRHTSVDVEPGTCYGCTDVPVKDTFEEEAAITQGHLKGIVFDQVYCSPLSRASKLAEFCGYPNAKRDDRIKEMNMGEWEMQKFDSIQDPQLQEWYNDFRNTPTQGGESFKDLYTRVVCFLEEIKSKNYKRIAVFAHGGVLISARIYAKQIPEANGFEHLTPYGGIERIEI